MCQGQAGVQFKTLVTQRTRLYRGVVKHIRNKFMENIPRLTRLLPREERGERGLRSPSCPTPAPARPQPSPCGCADPAGGQDAASALDSSTRTGTCVSGDGAAGLRGCLHSAHVPETGPSDAR